jgi:hypothetical protein
MRSRSIRTRSPNLIRSFAFFIAQMLLRGCLWVYSLSVAQAMALDLPAAGERRPRFRPKV